VADLQNDYAQFYSYLKALSLCCLLLTLLFVGVHVHALKYPGQFALPVGKVKWLCSEVSPDKKNVSMVSSIWVAS
jgi:hypothetical protein